MKNNEVNELHVIDSSENIESPLVLIDESDIKGERETWSNKLDFFFSALGYAVGIGAVWRFPYLCYRNGGGAFLIPYLIFMLFVGIPLVCLELYVGQFTSKGPCNCWVMVELFRGIGLSMNITNFYSNSYYLMLLGYSLYFLVISFRAVLPWQYCNPSWSSSNCVSDYSPDNFRFIDCLNSTINLRCDNGRCYNLTTFNGTIASCDNDTSSLIPIGYWNPEFPSQDYWKNVILKTTENIDDTGKIVWQLVVCLFAACLIMFLMLAKGIKISGKLSYITSIFPYIILLIMGIRAWLLEGADIGVKYYIFPDFNKLKHLNVWLDAAVQVIFTLSVSYGGLLTLASYNQYNTNIMKHSIIISLCNCLTSIFAGFCVFAYLGYLAKQTGLDIDKVVQSGQGLAFVIFPFAVSTIKVAPLWSILFFIMMFLLGIDTMMTSLEVSITSLYDLFPWIRETHVRRMMNVAINSLVTFILGLVFCTQAGVFWIEIFDTYSGNWALFIIGLCEVISISWIYGLKNVRLDLETMLGSKVVNHFTFYIWCFCWTVTIPVLLLALVVMACLQSKRLELSNYVYPYWTECFGNSMSASVLLGIVVWAVYLVIDALFIHKRPLKTLLQPSSDWKPLKQENQILVKNIREQNNKTLEGVDNIVFYTQKTILDKK